MEHRITLPCHFGMEAVLKRELRDLGYEPCEVTDGRVSFIGDAFAVCAANIGLRTAERVLIEVGAFDAGDFEALFQGIRAIPWEEYLPRDARFWVTKAGSTDSALSSIPSIQSVAKKAMVERMAAHYGIKTFPEDGDDYPVRIFLRRDRASVYLDTSGAPLHKRGYRALTSAAPIAETLAAAILLLSPWRAERVLADPFCGSGTFAIEAAMMAANIAPGIARDFTAERWAGITPRETWAECRAAFRAREQRDISSNITARDIDPAMVDIARKNAAAAGVERLIRFEAGAAGDFHSGEGYGFIITNPPYGERLGDEAALPDIYRQLGKSFFALYEWSMYMISGYSDCERYIGRRADKRRKLYNGMMRTELYQYMGKKPERAKRG